MGMNGLGHHATHNYTMWQSWQAMRYVAVILMQSDNSMVPLLC